MKIIVFALLFALLGAPAMAGTEFWVAPMGSDRNPGTAARPFVTLERARDAIREMKKAGPLPKGGVTVWVRGGTYKVLTTLNLTEQDSGTADSPIAYRATGSAGGPQVRYHGAFGVDAGSYGGGVGGAVTREGTDGGSVSLGGYLPVGRNRGGVGATVSIGGGGRRSGGPSALAEDTEVRLIGGQVISGFAPVRDPAVLQRLSQAARGKVLQADLKAQGVTDSGEMTARGFGRAVTPAGMELFFNGKPMTMAEWPNAGWIETTSVPDGPNGGKFGYDSDRPAKWVKSDDIWVHGYWTWPWADSYEHIKSIDTQAKMIETYPPHGIYGYSEHKRFRFLNVLEELDAPGEWYLDRKTAVLYFWPPEKNGEAVVSISQQPIVSLSDASYVTLRGFTIEACRGNAIEISGGTHNLIAGCTIRNAGNVGVTINGGTQNGVKGCDIYETGDGGVSLAGGDRMTLTPADNFVDNCDIHDYSRWVRTYRPAVLMSGVGNRVSHCHLHDAPHTAVLITGNEHIIEFNEFDRVLRETGDAGAFYIGRDWTMRGNEVRFNYFHDLGGFDDKYSSVHFSDTMAVYLDDWASGTRVYGNLFYKANRAVMIGGGRDNTVQNNVFVDCNISVHVDARGIAKWTEKYWDGSYPVMFDRLSAVNGTKPPYSTKYPQLANILNDEPRLPKGNSITRNVSSGSKTWIAWIDQFDHSMVEVKDNLVDQDPLFENAAKLDFRLKADSPALKLGFKPLPLDKMGLYADEYRRIAE